MIPNLLVEGISRAIRESPAVKAYFVNLMWQPGETIGFRASDHVEAINRHAGGNLLDCIVVNTRAIRPSLLRRYEAQRSKPVVNDTKRLAEMGVAVAEADLLSQSSIVRHDPEVTGRIAISLAVRGRAKRNKLLKMKGIHG